LFGRTPYGPGRYIFGCLEHDFEAAGFKLIQDAPEVETAKQRHDSGSRSRIKLSGTRRPSSTIGN